MATGDIFAIAINANGVTMTTVWEGGEGLGTLDTAARATLTITSESGSVLGTVTRTVSAKPVSVSADGADTVIEWHLIHETGAELDGAHVYDPDTGITVDIPVGVLDGDFTTNEVNNGAVMNNSTLAYPKPVLFLDFIPRRKFTGSFDVDFFALALMGVDRCEVTLTDVDDDSVTKTAAIVEVASRGDFGPAAMFAGACKRLYRATFNVDTDNGGGAFALGLAWLKIVVYPRVGDAAAVYDTSTATVHPKQDSAHVTAWDLECYLDPSNTESARDTTIAWTDPTRDVAIGSVTGGPYTDWEFAIGSANETPIVVIGSIASSPLKFQYAEGEGGEFHAEAYKMTPTGVTGTPQSGDLFVAYISGFTRYGVVLDFGVAGAGVLRYLYIGGSAGSNFAASNSLTFYRGSSFASVATATAAAPSAIGLQASGSNTIGNGETIVGCTSGASCVTSGTSTANWSGSPAVGDIDEPYASIHAAGVALQGALSGRADGATIKCKKGMHMFGTSNQDARTSFYHLNITKADGLATSDVRLVDSWAAAGLITLCVRVYGVTIFGYTASAVITGNGEPYSGRGLPAGSTSVWVDDCPIYGWSPLQSMDITTAWGYSSITNCEASKIADGPACTHLADSYYHTLASDAFTNVQWAINVTSENIDQVDPLHSDMWQLNGSTANRGLYQVRCTDLIETQQAPFCGDDQADVAMVCVHQDPIGNAQLGDADMSNWMIVNCTLAGSNFQLRNTNLTAGAPTFANFTIRNSFIRELVKTEEEGAFTLYPSMANGNHYLTTNDEAEIDNAYDTGGAIGDLFDVTDDSSVEGHFMPAAAGALTSRVTASQILWGYDLYGRELPTDGTAAIGAIQVQEAAAVLVTPGTASLTLTTFAPTVQTPRRVVPGTAALTLTGYAPTVTGDATTEDFVGRTNRGRRLHRHERH